ncbi:MAG: endonuclease [Polaromonas sp.]|nr:endonuclease [Polaromonas sp.]
MSKLSHTRDKIYKTVARQMHGQVPCWVCGEHVLPAAATLEHIQPLSEGGSSHQENLAISHELCNNQRHALGMVKGSAALAGLVQRRDKAALAAPDAGTVAAVT